MRALGTLMILLPFVGCTSLARKVENDPYVLDYTFSPYFSPDSIGTVAVFSRLEGAPKPSLDKVAYDAATLQLLKTGKMDVVDRARTEEILREQEFSYSGLVDQNTAVRLGKLLGAKAVLFLDFISFEEDIDSYIVRVNAKLIDVETGRILYVASALGGGWSLEEAVSNAVKTALKPMILKAVPGEGQQYDRQ
ncbi:MAG: hypothetical protein GXO29_01035 [Thermotogae bacterium]|nr:hypothetical protein [Thermotogota bacterium]